MALTLIQSGLNKFPQTKDTAAETHPELLS